MRVGYALAIETFQMPLKILEDLRDDFANPTSQEGLEQALRAASGRMGFNHFALNYDEWLDPSRSQAFLIHDYPARWASVYINLDLGRNDPIRRACERSFTGFSWRELGRYVTMTPSDKRMLLIGHEHGLLDGYTVPRHLPGFATGSCTFVVGRGNELPRNMLPAAEMIGALALAAARQINGTVRPNPKIRLSDRQRDCVLLAACGMTTYETARVLGIKPATVVQHLRTARERYDVNCSESLVLAAIIDGLFGFAEVLKLQRKH